MIHSIKTERLKQYVYATSNQHGDRYKMKGWKNIRILRLSITHGNSSNEMFEFMALCSSLGIPPTWNEKDDKQQMSIEVVAASSII